MWGTGSINLLSSKIYDHHQSGRSEFVVLNSNHYIAAIAHKRFTIFPLRIIAELNEDFATKHCLLDAN